MPRSEFTRELAVAAGTEETWKTLTDVSRLVSWVTVVEDAVELEPLSRYTAVLMDRLGPFKLRADLDIVITDLVDGESLRVSAAGEDRQVGSRLTVEAMMAIAPREPVGTVVTFGGWYEVSGKVASMGSGTINKKAEKIMGDFFSSVTTALGSV